jgi:hypothetical protein
MGTNLGNEARERTNYYSARYLFKILAQMRAKRTKGNSKIH